MDPLFHNTLKENSSTWELKYNYCFYFKWGGALNSDQEVKDPKDLDTYDVPDTIQQTIKIVNPEKQTAENALYPWDYRRGYIKERAIKRMSQDIPTDSEFQYITEETPTKRQRLGATPRYPQEEDKEIQACLQTLCEKNNMPRVTRPDTPAAHQPAAPAARAAQVQHRQTPHELKGKDKEPYSTTQDC